MDKAEVAYLPAWVNLSISKRRIGAEDDAASLFLAVAISPQNTEGEVGHQSLRSLLSPYALP